MQAGAALAHSIRTMGSVSDTLDLERRTWLTHYVVDARILEAALEVAKDRESTAPSRIHALRTLIWQKAPGHRLSTAQLADAAPRPGMLRGYSSYTGHFYTDRGYGNGEHPWPVLGILPDEGYVGRVDRLVTEIGAGAADQRVVNAARWFLWYDQDPQLAELLEEERRSGSPGSDAS